MTMAAVVRVPSVPITQNHIVFPGIVETVSANAAYPAGFTLDVAPTDPETLDIARSVLSILRAEESLIFVYPVVDGAELDIGTLCRVVKTGGSSAGKLGLHGLCRAAVQQRLSGGTVSVELFPEDWATAEFSQQLVDKLKAVTMQYIGGHPQLTSRTAALLQMADVAVTPQMLVDLLSSVLPIGFDARVGLLKQLDPVQRCEDLIEVLKSKSPITKPLAVQKLGPKAGPQKERDSQEDDLAELKGKLQNILPQLPEEGQKTVTRDLNRLARAPPMSPDTNVIRTYLETVAEIPWGERNAALLTRDSVKRTQTILDQDHYGLKKAKQRLIEHVAVSYLRQQTNQQPSQISAPIILLVGPPGVGKTSLAKSVARALDRQLYRVSLGGVHDESEIRGHRRTYIGAMPGVIVQGLRKAGSMDPVLVLDEIDKIGQNSLHGDPAAALLEVLDPAQNSTFKDNYIGFPVDLSRTTFIATANYIETIPAPLLDRMEVIHIPGYSYVEKEHIAEQYLWHKQVKENGLRENSIELNHDALRLIITAYTRESGVRSLERQLGSICRGFAVTLLDEKTVTGPNESHATKILGVEDVRKFLGPEIFHDDVVNDEVDNHVAEDGTTKTRHVPGVVNGLAYMRSGLGGIMVFEATKIPGGSGKLKLTGALGDVITESANIALSWVRANAATLGIDESEFSKFDIHLHAPAGAIPKNGPSAGVAMTVCFVSLFTHRKVSRDLAMTGEITLRGKVLPVGGIREKLLGAHLAGIRRVILPFHCRSVVEEDFQSSAKGSSAAELEIVYAKYIWDVFAEVWPEETSLWQMHSNM